MRWGIRYADGSWYTNADGEPHDAPGGGVIVVVQEDDITGLVTWQGSDYYCFDECFGGWAGIDEMGLAQYLIEPGLKTIKLGKAISMDEWRRILAEAKSNPALPDKSARYQWERGF